MFKIFSKLLLLQLVIFYTALTFGNDNSSLIIENVTNYPERIVTSLLESSSVFDEFWTGVDGVSCGEPNVKITQINYADRNIIFLISLGGSGFECYERSYNCKVTYKLTKKNAIQVLDKAIDINDCDYY